VNALLAARPALGLTLLRVTLGIVFFMHGYMKVFGYGIDALTGGFTQLGIPLAAVAAPTVAAIELVGGVLVILGVYPRVIGTLFATVVTGAIIFAKSGAGFFAPDGYELELTLALASVAMAIGGGGEWTVMSLFKKKD